MLHNSHIGTFKLTGEYRDEAYSTAACVIQNAIIIAPICEKEEIQWSIMN
ncbi:hypothetical protein J1N10_12625 [Carboxylicivirga sp. A043]|nr:hypothetical protein [Carboxylicivirga sp. A043]MCU4156825.1 hypothetical protein [Carboxylicivirga sp. A043]